MTTRFDSIDKHVLGTLTTVGVIALLMNATCAYASTNVWKDGPDNTVVPVSPVAVSTPAQMSAAQPVKVLCGPGEKAFAVNRGSSAVEWCAMPDASGNYVRSGSWVSHASGRTQAAGRYAQGKREGVWTFYAAPGGAKSLEGSYRSGMADGIWTSWDDKGEVKGIDEYRDGQLVNRWIFESYDAPQAQPKQFGVQISITDWADHPSDVARTESAPFRIEALIQTDARAAAGARGRNG